MPDSTKKPNLRPRLNSDAASTSTPPSSSSSSANLNRIDSVVQKAVAVAMERERKLLRSDMEKRENKLQEILDEKLASLHDLEASIDTKLSQLRDLSSTVGDNTSKVNELANRLDHIEQYSRRNNIRLLGVKATPNEDTDKIVCDIARQIGVDISPNDIDRSHRLPNRRSADHDSNESYANAAARNNSAPPPPIIVKFMSHKAKFQMMKNRRKLKGSGTVIVEDLTKKNVNLLAQTSRRPSVKASWTSDGRVFALVKTTGGREMKKLITSFSELNSL